MMFFKPRIQPKLRFKCGVIGTQKVGKTAMVAFWIERDFMYPYRLPSAVDPWVEDITLGNKPCELEIIDHYGSEENCYERLRGYYLTDSDVCLICFSVESPTSYEEVRTKWLGEVQRAVPDTELVLVGMQIDKRDENAECLTKEDGERLAEEIGAKKYIECTSNKPEEMKKLLDETVLGLLRDPPGRKPKAYKRPWYLSFLPGSK